MDTRKTTTLPRQDESGKPSLGSASLGVRWFARAENSFDLSAPPLDLSRAAGARLVLKPNSGRVPAGAQREILVRVAPSRRPDLAAEDTRYRKELLGQIIGRNTLPVSTAAAEISRSFPRLESDARKTPKSLGVRGTRRSAQDTARGQTREPKGTAGKISLPVAGEFRRCRHGNSRRHA